MAEVHVATWSGGSTYIQFNLSQGGQSNAGNGTTTVNWSAVVRDTHSTVSGTWDWSYNFYGYVSNSGSYSASPRSRTLGSGAVTVYHDANGNAYVSGASWLDVYYGNATATQGLTPSKIYRSAGWSSSSSSNIKPTTATITNTVADWGIGTSHGHKMYYRIQGSGSGWTATSDEGSTNPKSWNLTGLKPGKVYEYYGAQWNNNTSAVNGTTQTFKTKGIPGAITLLSGAI